MTKHSRPHPRAPCPALRSAMPVRCTPPPSRCCEATGTERNSRLGAQRPIQTRPGAEAGAERPLPTCALPARSTTDGREGSRTGRLATAPPESVGPRVLLLTLQAEWPGPRSAHRPPTSGTKLPRAAGLPVGHLQHSLCLHEQVPFCRTCPAGQDSWGAAPVDRATRPPRAGPRSLACPPAPHPNHTWLIPGFPWSRSGGWVGPPPGT